VKSERNPDRNREEKDRGSFGKFRRKEEKEIIFKWENNHSLEVEIIDNIRNYIIMKTLSNIHLGEILLEEFMLQVKKSLKQEFRK